MNYPLQNVKRSSSHEFNSDGTFVGIHLSGPNAKKSALVSIESNDSQTTLGSLYEKIGSVGSLFSDERIIDILTYFPKLVNVFVDCPITEPPCVKCVLPVCPGVLRCDDVAVGMMLAIEQKRGRKGGHKLRPLNPQNLRLWDAMYGRGEFGAMEPPYSANLAPLVVRARTLQRRLRSILPDVTLEETSVPFLLKQLETMAGMFRWHDRFRSFEHGFKCRQEILKVISGRLQSSLSPNLTIQLSEQNLEKVAHSVELFNAFMSGAMSVWAEKGFARVKPSYFVENSGWVELLNEKSVAES